MVNEMEILYITGRTGKYLEPVAGKANWNITCIARKACVMLPVLFGKS
jgi:two-component system CheB/CheR fusion protein